MTFVRDPRPIQMVWTGPAPWTPAQEKELCGPMLTDREPIIKHPKGPRFMRHHPASWQKEVPGESDSTHNMAQFYTMLPASREAFDAALLEAWKTGPNAGKFTFGISCHLSMVDPFRQFGMARYWNATLHNELAAMWDGVIRPWHELVGAGSRPGPGVYEWGMEGGFTDVDHHNQPPGGWGTALPLSKFLMTKGIRSIGEAVPYTSDGIDFKKLEVMPAWCLPQFADGNIKDLDVSAATEVHLLMVSVWKQLTPGGPYVPTPQHTVEQIKGWLKRGFIVGGDVSYDDLIRQAMAEMSLL